jgi:hypothetical protein
VRQALGGQSAALLLKLESYIERLLKLQREKGKGG